MSEVIDAIKIWQQQNAPTIKGLDVAKQNAISQALNFFNKKFGGEGELIPLIEEKIIAKSTKEKKYKSKSDKKVANGLIKEAEEEIVFADLEALENEIESINFEELEQLDKELDDLF